MGIGRTVESGLGSKHRTEHVGRGGSSNCNYRFKRGLLSHCDRPVRKIVSTRKVFQDLQCNHRKAAMMLMWDQPATPPLKMGPQKR